MFESCSDGGHKAMRVIFTMTGRAPRIRFHSQLRPSTSIPREVRRPPPSSQRRAGNSRLIDLPFVERSSHYLLEVGVLIDGSEEPNHDHGLQ